jgi:hypothetical protein
MRAYRAAPRIAVALAPALPPSRSLLGRLHELITGLGSRLPGIGGTGDPAAVQIAASGGTRGAGMVALAKLLALCAGAAGGACVATGVLPAPDLTPQHTRKPVIERSSLRQPEAQTSEAVQYEPAPAPAPQPEPVQKPAPKEEPESPSTETTGTPTGAVEYEPPPPPPAPEPTSASGSEGSSSGSAAGEFGP